MGERDSCHQSHGACTEHCINGGMGEVRHQVERAVSVASGDQTFGEESVTFKFNSVLFCFCVDSESVLFFAPLHGGDVIILQQ